ncbi:TRAP transporter small permease subunit [Jiella pacifica]|uniref:TRAP transporter small permease protein n=1 Tax=Jiella pacifica TaxID=2696469 RepID=A0A6N9T761_9HYPH|nr:TRAP transporter small permease subunit [Jiella pacifica]NDW06045.1 TRAP transporter small permease subunit [Jiella pacifica]
MGLGARYAAGMGRVSGFLGKACGVFYLAAILISLFEIFARYVFDSPTVWTPELVMALCATAWMLSVGAVTQQHRHITVTVMEILVGQRVWQAMRTAAVVASMLAVAGLFWASYTPFTRTLNHLERSGSAFNPPFPSYLKAMILVALALYFLQLLANLVGGPGSAQHDEGLSDRPLDMPEHGRG